MSAGERECIPYCGLNHLRTDWTNEAPVASIESANVAEDEVGHHRPPADGVATLMLEGSNNKLPPPAACELRAGQVLPWYTLEHTSDEICNDVPRLREAVVKAKRELAKRQLLYSKRNKPKPANAQSGGTEKRGGRRKRVEKEDPEAELSSLGVVQKALLDRSMLAVEGLTRESAALLNGRLVQRTFAFDRELHVQVDPGATEEDIEQAAAEEQHQHRWP